MLDFINQIPLIGGTLTYLIPFLVLLTAVVFVHELGHYMVARWCGVRSEVFSVGFGPELFGWTDALGTRWRFSWIPLGGYVRFLGDDDVSSTTQKAEVAQDGAFATASLRQRTAIVSAGPLMNFIFAALTLAVVSLLGGLPEERAIVGPVENSTVAASLGLQTGDQIEIVNGTAVASYPEARAAIAESANQPIELIVSRNGERVRLAGTYAAPVLIGGVVSDSPADVAGFEVEDEVIAIDGQAVNSFNQLAEVVRSSGGRELSVEIRRAGIRHTMLVTPELRETVDPATGTMQELPVIGVRQQPTEILPVARRSAGVGESVAFGVTQTVTVIVLSLDYVGKLIVGATSTDDLGGPIAIAEFSGQAAQQGVWDFLYLLAVISASIGLINLFPIPVLDGGHLVLYAIEGVRGKPLGERTVRIATQIGLCLVLLLMVFVTYNDLLRL